MKEKRPGSGQSAEEVVETGYAAFKRGKRLSVPGKANKIFAARHVAAGFIASILRVINRFRGVGAQTH